MGDLAEHVFERDGKFYFHDETGDDMGPYRSRRQAERTLKDYLRWLNHGPTWWQSLYWPLRYTLVPRIRNYILRLRLGIPRRTR